MEIEIVALVLSIVSTIVAFVDIYINQYRKGRVTMPPLRVYRLEPLNFHSGGESYRGLRLTAALTFVNTGALTKVVDNLRIRIEVPGVDGPLMLEWRDECESLESGPEGGKFATQPSLGPYSSLSKIYSFKSRSEPEIGRRVSTLEQFGTDHPERTVAATIEMLENGRWTRLRMFNLTHSGMNLIETDFSRINLGASV